MNAEANAIYCNRCGFKSGPDAQFCQSCGESLRVTAGRLPQHEVQPSYVAPFLIPAPTVRYAGFWIRVVASLLDFVVVFVALIPVRMLMGSTTTLLGEAWDFPTARTFYMGQMVRLGIGIVVAWLYRAGMESSRFQGTLGKIAVQIKVTDLEGKRITFERATGRYLAKFLSAIALGVGYLMVGFTPQKQGLHDRIAGTLVLYK